MMRGMTLVTALALVTLSFAGVSMADQAVKPDAHGFIAAQPEDLAAQHGIRTVILGDPSKPGLYIVRLTFAPGQGSRPHYHDQARYITVIKGTWWVSLGPDADVYDPAKTQPMKPGSFLYEPAFGHHYDMAKDEPVTVQIMGMGPVKTIPLGPGGLEAGPKTGSGSQGATSGR
ncbi:MAG TPA: cupin domain-containing protein [Gammaproteobacteria bacterium]|nr:cupin domain-containing protein [Gammaproteobacteria bacterium]